MVVVWEVFGSEVTLYLQSSPAEMMALLVQFQSTHKTTPSCAFHCKCDNGGGGDDNDDGDDQVYRILPKHTHHTRKTHIT